MPSSRPLSALSSLSPHTLARALAIAIAIGLMFSPPLANLGELLLVLTVALSGQLRRRVAGAWAQPLFKASVAFWLVTGLGVLYSIAPPGVSASMWGGWRKLLLLPLALALFDDPAWKRRFGITLIGATVATALVSFLSWFMGLALIDAEAGVLVRNHSSQGMIFAVAAFAAGVLALSPGRRRGGLLAAAAILLANIAFVTPGRSGYIVLLACGAAFGLWWLARHGLNARTLGMAMLVMSVLAALLAAAPTSRARITQAWQEMTQYRQARVETSMGIRVIFWKNALQLIRERPLLGYGTGAFGEAYGRLVAGRAGLEGTPAGDPHNQYMKIAGEHGLVGLATFLAMLAAALRQRPSAPWRLLGLGALAAWCATSLANSHFSTFTEGSFIYLWLGVMLARENRQAGENGAVHPPRSTL